MIIWWWCFRLLRFIRCCYFACLFFFCGYFSFCRFLRVIVHSTRIESTRRSTDKDPRERRKNMYVQCMENDTDKAQQHFQFQYAVHISRCCVVAEQNYDHTLIISWRRKKLLRMDMDRQRFIMLFYSIRVHTTHTQCICFVF